MLEMGDMATMMKQMAGEVEQSTVQAATPFIKQGAKAIGMAYGGPIGAFMADKVVDKALKGYGAISQASLPKAEPTSAPENTAEHHTGPQAKPQ